MNSFSDAFVLLNKKPFIWIVPGLFMVPFCIFEYQVIYPLIHGISNFGIGNVYEVLFYLIQFTLAGFNAMISSFPKNIVILIGAIISLFLISLVFSGYLYVINGCVNERDTRFINGLKKYFFRINNAVLITFFVSTVFFLFSVIAAIPALILTRTFVASGITDAIKSQINSIITTVSLFLVNTTTILVILFELSLLILYFSFWFASIYCFEKESFKPAKRVVNRFFWSLVSGTISFGILFMIFEIAFSKGSIWLNLHFPDETVEIFFIVFMNALIKAFLLGSYISYIFIEYKKRKKLLFG